MSAGACQVLRHDVRSRRVGDLLTAYCLTCECLCVRDLSCPDPAPGGDSPLAVPRSAGARSSRLPGGWPSRPASGDSNGSAPYLDAAATTAGVSTR